MRASLTIDTEIGPLTVTETNGAIAALDWGVTAVAPAKTPLLAEAARQIRAYLARRQHSFDLPLQLAGSPFQQQVYRAMMAIPYGAVRSYGDIAKEVDAGPRAVGGACAANPLPILVPCHRVVAAGRKLGGYSGHGGLATKRFLLGIEGAMLDLRASGPEVTRRRGPR
jgi:methylated-DNA-[protein]-cysteine S-methyltransferase